MIYIDSSVVLAYLFDEERSPPESLWNSPLISSRLLELEVDTVVNRARDTRAFAADAQQLLLRVAMIEVIPEVLHRARQPFPKPVRTLDAIHVASADFVRSLCRDLQIATYDERLGEVAAALGFELLL